MIIVNVKLFASDMGSVCLSADRHTRLPMER